MNTILLVDDDTQMRTVYGIALRSRGYKVLEADSGLSALEMARKHLPDLILSDIHMPGGDGSTLLRALRRDPELRFKQIVLMTGRPDLVTSRRGMEEGADDFLVKPVSMEALLACMEARFNRASISWRVEDQMLAKLRALVPPNLPHEFFTPLAGIIGLMELLRTDFPKLTSAEVSSIHKDVYQSALRLHRTLRNYLLILDLESISSEPLPTLAPEEVMESLQMGIAETLRQDDDRQSDLTVEIDPERSLAVKGEDIGRLVEELVDNAFKFSRRGTPVRVELTSKGELIVTDQGRGLTPEEIDQIGAFRQFERKKHEQQGLGLGLVLVQKLASQYNAVFSIESQPGKGTRVKIAFPRAGLMKV